MDDFAPYRVQDFDRSTLPTGRSTWKVTFLRQREQQVVDLNLDSVAFVALDLDRRYALGDLIQLREDGVVVD